ncbi:hypothetical protein, partial [Muribacter muris]
MNTFENQNRGLADESEFEQAFMQAVVRLQIGEAKQVKIGQFEYETQTTETMTSQQYQQLQKLQQMANDLLAAIDEAFPYKTKEAAPIARRKQFLSLPKAQADSVARLRSEVALVAKNGFVERGSLGLTVNDLPKLNHKDPLKVIHFYYFLITM